MPFKDQINSLLTQVIGTLFLFSLPKLITISEWLLTFEHSFILILIPIHCEAVTFTRLTRERIVVFKISNNN